MIKSTKHHIRDLNREKLRQYREFLREYSKYCIAAIDYFWNNGYAVYIKKDNNNICLIFDVKNGYLDLPNYLDYKLVPATA